MNTIKGNGFGWILDNSVRNSAVEDVLRRVEGDYDGVCEHLSRSIYQMQVRGDGDAMLLIQKLMMLAVNDISGYFGTQPVAVVGDHSTAC